MKTEIGRCDACATPEQHVEVIQRGGMEIRVCINYKVCNARIRNLDLARA